MFPFTGSGEKENLSFTFSGGNAGYRCNMFAYVHKGEGAVVMTNSDKGGQLISEIYRAIAAEYHWTDHIPQQKEIIHVNEDTLSTFTGVYLAKQPNGKPMNIKVYIKHKKLFVSVMGESYELLPESENDYIIPQQGWEVCFDKDKKGICYQLRYFMKFGPGTAAMKDYIK
jgi:hypothetical protein